MTKLNIGCSNYPIRGEDWINLDQSGNPSRWEYGPFKDSIQEFDVTELPWKYPKNSIDTIILSHIMNQIESKYHLYIYREAYRVLQPNGRLLITDDNHNDRRSIYYLKPHIHTITLMRKYDILAILKEIGFKEVNIKEGFIEVNNHPELDSNSKFFIEATK